MIRLGNYTFDRSFPFFLFLFFFSVFFSVIFFSFREFASSNTERFWEDGININLDMSVSLSLRILNPNPWNLKSLNVYIFKPWTLSRNKLLFIMTSRRWSFFVRISTEKKLRIITWRLVVDFFCCFFSRRKNMNYYFDSF